MDPEHGNRGRGIGGLDRALALRPGDASVHRELGMHRYAGGDLDGAIASFLTATSLRPDDAGLWASLGGLYLVGGDRERAAEAFTRSLSIQPGYAALSNLGTLRYGQGEYAAAAELYRQAASLDPGDFRIWGNLGDAASAAGGNGAGEAARAYGRAADMAGEYLAIKPGDAQAIALLGWYQANLGRGDEARRQVGAAEALARPADRPAPTRTWSGSTGWRSTRRSSSAERAQGRADRGEAAPVLWAGAMFG